MNISFSLDRAIALWPERTALVDGEAHFTYRQTGERVAKLASALAARGFTKGSVAAVIAPNSHEFFEIYYACALLGAVVNPINFRLSAREVALILNDSGAVALFCHTDFSHLAAGSASECPGLGHVVWIGGGERPALHAVSVAYEAALDAGVVDAALRVES